MLDHGTMLHHHHLIGDGFHRGQIMGDKHVGKVELALQPVKQLEDALLHDLVQGTGHLVTNDKLRFSSKSPCDADALFLPTRKL